MGQVSQRIRFQVIDRDGGKCRYCGRSAPEVVIEIDHIVPRSAGGTNTLQNLCVSCRECNRGKRDTIVGAAFEQPLRDAIERGRGLVYVEMYCRNSDCPCREVELFLKDYERAAVEMLKTQGKTRCPVCGRILSFHWARSAEQNDRVRDREARESVNRQIYVRDHCKGGIAFYPASVMDDDSLPPFRECDLKAGSKRGALDGLEDAADVIREGRTLATDSAN